MALSDIWGDFRAELTGKKTVMQKQIPNLQTGFAPVVGAAGIARSAWTGLSTTGKVIVGAGAGAGAYAAYDYVFGKKATPIAQNPTVNQNPSQPVIVQPVVVQPNQPTNNQYDYSTQNNLISNSPYASIDSKKSMGLNAPFSPSQYVPFAVSPQQTTSAKQDTSASQGTDWATLAAIAGVALVAYGYTSRKAK